MAANSYLIKFGADASSVTKAINGIDTDMRTLNKLARSADQNFKLTGNTAELDKKLAVLQKQFNMTGDKVDTLKKKLATIADSNGGELPQTAKVKKLQNQLVIAEDDLSTFANRIKATENLKAGDGIASGMDKAGNAIESAGDKTEGLHGGLTKAGGAMASFVGNLAANAVSAGIGMIADSLGDVVSGAVEASDSIDNFKSTMTFAGASSKEIDKLTASSQDYANKTVYDLKTVLNTTAQLGANGVDNYGQLVQAAGNLNAVVGGNADTFGSVSMVLTQTAGAGKLTTDNWNQLADAIPGASGKLQSAMKKNGAYTGNFRDAMEKGQITSKEFNKAIMDLGMTKAAKEAATSTKTISGAMGNLQASAETVGTNILNGIKQPLTDSISFVADAIPKIADTIGGLGSAIASSGVGDALMSPFKTMFDSLSTIDLSPIISQFTAIGTTISGVFSNMNFSGLTQLASQIIPAVVSGFQSFMAVAGPAISSVVTAFGNLWNAAQPILAVIGSMLVPVFKILGGYLGGVFSGIMSTVSVAFNVLAGVAKVLTPVIQFVGKVFNAIAPYIQTAVTWFGKAQGSFNAMGGVFKAVGSVLGSVGGAIARVFSSMGSKLRSIFGGVNTAFSAVGTLFGRVGSSIGRVASSIIRFFSGIGGKIAVGFGNVVGKIAGKFSGVVGAIKGKFGDVSKIGMHIVKGIARGITGGFRFLKSVISHFVGNTVSFIKKLFKIHSPSRLMRDEVGTYITQGIGVGMTNNAATGSIRNAASSVTDTVMGSFSALSNPAFNASLVSNGSMATSTPIVTQAGSNVLTFNVSGSDPTRTANEIRKILRQENLI